MKNYLLLSKPGIILGNAITVLAGFMLASDGPLNVPLLFTTLLGLSLIIASACVFNNAIDQAIDAKMMRTKTRALVVGAISTQEALSFGAMLCFLGVFLLGSATNLLTLLMALIGLGIYVGIYSPLKPITPHATLIGSIAGAMPPLVGYAAAANQIDFRGILLFIIVVLWQMPHFFAIAVYRLKDYTAASIPVLPVAKGMWATKLQTLLYAIAYWVASLLPFFFGFVGYLYLMIASLFGLYWVWLCWRGFSAEDDTVWAKQVFRFSLLVILAISLLLCY